MSPSIEIEGKAGLTLADLKMAIRMAEEARAPDSSLVYGSSRINGRLRRLKVTLPPRFAEREVHKNV